MKTEYQIEIINRVRRLREAHQCSQTQLAGYLGLSDGQIGNVESLRFSQKYTLAQLYKICKLFDTTIAHLFIDDDERGDDIDIVDLLIKKIIKYEN